ncbi:hypothetical protein V8E36_002634 [Tilletia maclaganii]
MPAWARTFYGLRYRRQDSPYPHHELTQLGTAGNPLTVDDTDDDGTLATGGHTPQWEVLFYGGSDAMEVDNAIGHASADAVGDAVERIIEGGEDGNPPHYTEPSYRQRLDDCLAAYSVMPADRRKTWFTYFRRYIGDEVEQEVEARVANLRARNDTLTNDTIVLRRHLAKTGDASSRFKFHHNSLWSKSKYHKNDFKNMHDGKVRTLAEQLLKAAHHNRNHPIIKNNKVYRACLERFDSFSNPTASAS